MSKLELVREMYWFNEWANNLILEKAAAVSEADLKAKPDYSYTTILTNLGHICGAQVHWLQRWQHGGSLWDRKPKDVDFEWNHSVYDEAEYETLERVRADFERSHKELREYLDGMTEERMNAVTPHTDRRGNTWERPLWRMMLHVANHGSFHRGELALCLTALGHSPGDMDFLRWAHR